MPKLKDQFTAYFFYRKEIGERNCKERNLWVLLLDLTSTPRVDALMTYSANLDDAQFNQMLTDIIISLENLKTSPTEGRRNRLDRFKAYLQARDS